MPSFSPPPRRPRILQVVSHLGLGGAERVALNIARALRDEFEFVFHAVRGIEPDAIGKALAEELRAHGIPFHCGARVPMRFGGVLISSLQLARVVKRARPDILHLHTEIPEAACATMLAFQPARRPRPLVRTIHNSRIWDFAPAFGHWCDRRLAHAHIAAVSRGALEAFHRLRRDSRAAAAPGETTIFNGVVEKPLQTSSSQTERRPLRLLYGGRFEAEKGVDLFPEIFRHLGPISGSAELVIQGHGRLEPLLRQLAANPPAGWRIEIRAAQPDFAQQLPHFDLVLIPSRYEGLCLVAIEAALAGVPIVASDAPGLREALPRDHPWCARAGDAADFAAVLDRAITEKPRWSSVAEATRHFARARFSVEQMTEGYRTLYRSLAIASEKRSSQP
jgi:Glycosyltransferase